MSRFGVYELKGISNTLVLDVQSDMFSAFQTRVVIPLQLTKQVGSGKMSRLNPTILINGEHYSLIVDEMASINLHYIGDFVTNIENQRHVIIDAMDFLFQGF
jgi:hypothetical protein